MSLLYLAQSRGAFVSFSAQIVPDKDHNGSTVYVVTVKVDGKRQATRTFRSREDAERFKASEVFRATENGKRR